MTLQALPHNETGLGQGDASPAVSVVVIGRNEGQRLARCLESIRKSDYPPDRIEVIYVDSASTDDSVATARRLGATVVELPPGFLSAAAARNAGLAAASCELIQFLDGDTILHRDWLPNAVRHIAPPDVGAVFGHRHEVDSKANTYSFWAHHDWYVPPGEASYCGGDVMFKAAPLRQVGGYDASLIAGEEQDLVFRFQRDCGLKVLSLDLPMTLHDINMHRFSQYWRRCYRAGYAYAEVADRFPALRPWRRICWRNGAHVLVAMIAVAASLIWMTPWPVAAWAGLLIAAVCRNAFRVRTRVGPLGDSLLYSWHLYLCKLPMFCGQMNYRLRKLFGLRPQRLIEYNQPAATRTADVPQGT